IAKKYSDDPAAQTNGGDLGWITVFSLPYELENLAYSIPVGKSGMYQSRAGIHIFKNLGERRDPGRMKASQILLAFPPDATEQSKLAIKKLADSLYNRLLKGDDFGKLASTFSNDVISAAANGQMQEFAIGQYDPIFEKEVYALAKDGDITAPFLTSHGYHIVKRISKTPIVTNKSNKVAMQLMEDKVEQSDRINTTKLALAKKVMDAAYKKQNFNEAELWAFSDSILSFKPAGMPIHLNYSSALFTLGDKTFTVSEWMNYAQTFRYKPDGSGIKPYAQLWNEFLNTSAVDYYQSHLENYNDEVRQQITEFREGNLFFEIMQREVWTPAQTDSVNILNYYNRNKSKYNWNKSADAVMFYATDLASAKTFRDQLVKSPRSWSRLVNNFSEKITADSSRFELKQIPNVSKLPLKGGTITNPVVNTTDRSASFAYIIRTYDKPSTRSFAEARALVVNDYQKELEQKWLAELNRKYPVRVNEKALAQMLR
ncbi:MAG: peptidylprolyl isomerase, partial [Flavisolibacter sp.]